ncbi:hypothetical protein GF385_04150, partial [Candidatus Dependentiae bacterium]|nr:hypothetical protein [Candidatus Dependentiae bacterium]
MTKKLLYIFIVFSFFTSGFSIQKLYGIENEESTNLEELEFSDIDFD